MTFTIEQLEALKEGTTPGPWVVKRESPTMQQAYFNIHRHGDHRTRIKGYTNGHSQDPELIAASPALLDQLIATETKLQKVLKSIEGLRTECIDVVLRSGSGHEEYTGNEVADRIADAHWDALTQILEEANDFHH
ncbi:hypothetical protein [Corynebacterium callunae]|uniref:hypothetical protein n=1 Tax=Corynebacterium callunae TaxID=1721 RepID=UPI001FFF3827|nr:hypothetical protein [Corynebacterium callunae]MCK2200502.1 hypothetical protein [Corynebacterium callunae]